MNTVADELAIRSLVARYADAVNRRSEEDWAATWAEDGVWALASAGEFTGREAIVATWKGAMAGFPWVVQLVHNGHVSIDGETAVGRWYLEEKLQLASGGGMQNVGVYQDQYRKVDGEWLFARREYTVLFNDAGSGTTEGTTATVPDGFKV